MRYATDMSAWLAAAPFEPGKITDIFTLSGRSYGKSLLMGDLFKLARDYSATTKIEPTKVRTIGNGVGDLIILDEFDSYPFDGLRSLLNEQKPYAPWVYDGELLASFKDPDRPGCDTYASIERLDKRDPLNPNPAAGSSRRFLVTIGKNVEQVRNKTTAIARAEAAHKRLVAEVVAKEEEAKRQLAIAQAEAAELAALNLAHLQALPAYGGF